MFKENNNPSPQVSVCMITYNHAAYIAQAIESVLMQKISFELEIVIGEDCSTDGTAAICEQYQEKFSDKIRMLARKQNLGVARNFMETLQACRGKYIALCEGDDYWTDLFKLQKQVDFLERHSEYALSHHDAATIDREGQIIADSRLAAGTKSVYEESELLRGPQMITCTMVFRNILRGAEVPPEYWSAFGSDKLITVMLGLHGKAYLHREVGNSMYRVHGGGVYSALADPLDKLEKTLSTRLAIYLFLKRMGRNERFYVLTRHILPMVLKIYRLKGQNFYFAALWKIIKFFKK